MNLALESRTYFDNVVACNGALFFEAELPVTIVGYNIRDASSIRPLEIAALRGHILEADKVNRFSITTYGLSVLLIVMKIDLQEDVVILELLQDENDELLWNCREFSMMP